MDLWSKLPNPYKWSTTNDHHYSRTLNSANSKQSFDFYWNVGFTYFVSQTHGMPFRLAALFLWSLKCVNNNPATLYKSLFWGVKSPQGEIYFLSIKHFILRSVCDRSLLPMCMLFNVDILRCEFISICYLLAGFTPTCSRANIPFCVWELKRFAFRQPCCHSAR